MKKVNLSLKGKTSMVIISQVVFIALLGAAYFYSTQKFGKIYKEQQVLGEEMKKVNILSMQLKDYFNKQISFLDLQESYRTFKESSSDTTELNKFERVWNMIVQVEDNNNLNSQIEKDVMDLTEKSIGASNSYINSMAEALADPIKRNKISILERLVIAGANSNNNNNYQVQVLFKNLKEDINSKASLLSFIDKSVENATNDIERLANTPFEQLAVGARDANLKIKELVKTYIKNTESNNELNVEIFNSSTELSLNLIATNEASTAGTFGFIRKVLAEVILVLLIVSIIVILLNLSLSKTITSFVKGHIKDLKMLSNGDLTLEFNEKKLARDDEIGVLHRGIYNLAQKLKEIVGGITMSSSSFFEASMQLSSSSQQLSQGASEQAASNEEISSSMEQMAANIEQNTSNSKETEKISESASRGIEAVSGAAQQSLNSIRNIADKILIINDIAFQTNILALNAAVEAARAGEHGKGFAVVAAEVRKLAERSKIAADEIVALTNESNQVTEEAGGLMAKLIPDIQKTSKLVQEISAASMEQNSGAGQVNSSIQQLNSITQQNAASSEELATSAEELASQAEQLKDLISFFKLEKGDLQNIVNDKPAKKKSTNGKVKLNDKSTTKDFVEELHEEIKTQADNQEIIEMVKKSDKNGQGVEIDLAVETKDDEFENF